MKTIKLDGVEISEDKLREIIKNNPELVEEKKGRWKPEYNQWYFIINKEGKVDRQKWHNNEVGNWDDWNWKTNNVFKTKEEAEQRKAEIEALSKINNYIDENELMATVDNVSRYKYYVSTHHGGFCPFPESLYYNINTVIPPLKSSESAREIIDKFEEELKVVFKVK